MTWDTVAEETFARAATSLIVVIMAIRKSLLSVVNRLRNRLTDSIVTSRNNSIVINITHSLVPLTFVCSSKHL
jgi:hypothetical protein